MFFYIISVIIIILLVYITFTNVDKIEGYTTLSTKHVNLKTIPIYYLTTNCVGERATHIQDIFNPNQIRGFLPELGIHHRKSGASGFIRILKYGLTHQNENQSFKPFMILEDDVSYFRKWPDKISYPSNCDILYIGLSVAGLRPDKDSHDFIIYYHPINKDIIRIYNMLSLHGIIVCSKKGANILIKCMEDGYKSGLPWDIFTAIIQPYYQVYALTNPLVYQDIEYGGQQRGTDEVFNPNINKNSHFIDKIHGERIQKYACLSYAKQNSTNIHLRKNIDEYLKTLGSIEKKIHVTWKHKNLLNYDFNIIKYGIRQLKHLNPDYILEISDNKEVDDYLKDNISPQDYNLIKNRHIVEKVDLWRLLKIYNEGGVYMDIDRFYNIPLFNIIQSKYKCILPLHYDINFSQDIMISASRNIFYKEAIRLNLEHRRNGCQNILDLGPRLYFKAITKVLLGRQINEYPSKENLKRLTDIINNSQYLTTYREIPPYDTIIYQGPEIKNDKMDFYNYDKVSHWTK